VIQTPPLPATSDEAKKRSSWGTIAITILATYVLCGFVLVTLEGIGWLNPTLGRTLLPIFYPFLWPIWSLPGLRDASTAYVNWLRGFR
jgi:hypothetical protein